MADVLILLGTAKGVFLVRGDAARESWRIDGPHCQTWPINHVKANPATGWIHACGGTAFHGLDIWTSEDLGQSWRRSGQGIALPEGEEAQLDAVWSLGFADRTIYAGTKPAHLFASHDGGDTWALNAALFDHETRAQWMPGGAGLTLHHIVADPAAPERVWVGISSAGVFYSGDGGQSWTPRNQGVRVQFGDMPPSYPEVGNCVHALALAPGTRDILYQQNHCGMYRSSDGAAEWVSIEAGLPSSFGFCLGVHPRDPDTAWYLPMNGDVQGRFAPGGRPAVWRTRDGGESWQDLRTGLPQAHCYFTVLRQAMAVDDSDPAGVYFGTNSGTLYASRDEGDDWFEIARDLPLINSVEVMRLG